MGRMSGRILGRKYKNMFHYSDENIRLLEGSSIPLAVYQFIDDRVVTVALSDGFCELLGMEDKQEAYDLMDNDMYRYTHPDDAARVADIAWRFATGQTERYEALYRSRKPGSDEYFVLHSQGVHKMTETGERIAVIWYTDEGTYIPAAPDQGKAPEDDFFGALNMENFLRTSYFDTLTGLPNMGHFFKIVESERAQAKKTGAENAFLFINLNGMKSFNRKHGYGKGDQLLISFAKMLARHFGNDNCSRFGQDQFAVYTRAGRLDERVQSLINDNSKLNDGKNLPIRIGIYFDDDDEIDTGTACDRAKMAADSCRQARSSTFSSFNQNMLDAAERRLYIMENFDRALAEGWIQVYYQPIVRTANGRVCDEEALARWIDPVLGMLPPIDFIPILEEERLIYKLDLYVVDQIILKLKAQAERGLDVVPGSINISRVDFDMCDIVEEIRKKMDAAGMPHDKLTIEITESVVGSDFEFMKEQISRFHDLGFKVWMDDFGSGYSSLDVLQGIPFDLIKFDMHFMRTFYDGEESKIILTELMRMALGLGAETVTEGVETAEQMEFLREIGCSKLQGFYYCKPIPFEEVLRRYDEGRQIGFENPEEAQYYATLGSVNLYDMSVIARDDEDASLSNYFSTIPMAVVESDGSGYKLVRCNSSYRELRERIFGQCEIGRVFGYDAPEGQIFKGFSSAIRQCGETGSRSIIDEELADGSTVHAFMRRLAINPVSGAKAIVIAILAVIEKDIKNGTTYEHMAKALASDYRYLYYVNIETGDFIEYSTAGNDIISIEKHGDDFFRIALANAAKQLHPDDVVNFTRRFSKDNILESIERYGSFSYIYRLLMGSDYKYVSMKAMSMRESKHIIIGVSDIDMLMRQREEIRRLKADQLTYERINALAGTYISIYTVDPETERYTEYSSTQDYAEFGLAKEGEDFFRVSLEEGRKFVHPEDYARYAESFTKENVLSKIAVHNIYMLRYRLIMDGEPMNVNLRAALMEADGDGRQLVIGISDEGKVSGQA